MNCPACGRTGVTQGHLFAHRRRGELCTRKEWDRATGRWAMVWAKVEPSALRLRNEAMLARHEERQATATKSEPKALGGEAA